MHIKIDRIALSKLNYKITSFDVKELVINLDVAVESQFPEDNQLIQHVTFNLFHEVEKSPIDLVFTFMGHFSSEGEGSPTLKEFSEIHAPAYVVPYARELIANITSRTGGIVPTLVMPPLNLFEILKEKKESSE